MEEPNMKTSCLIFDAMAIKQETIIDPSTGLTIGFVDYGVAVAAAYKQKFEINHIVLQRMWR